MAIERLLPTSSNLSIAWAQAFLKVMQRGVTELSPLVVTVDDIQDGVAAENAAIRDAIDKHLKALQLQSCHTVANTIFPDSMWNANAANDADLLFERFDRAWPRLSRCRANNRGSYFRRLTAYQPNGSEDAVNQLKHIAATYKKGNHRRSALQAAIIDPTRDHNDCRQLGFPCLHQVAFAPTADDGLVVTGFYATQFLMDRAYGNYLGLCRLGRFMAKQMDLEFRRMICIASIAQRGTPNKSALQPLEKELTTILAPVNEASDA